MNARSSPTAVRRQAISLRPSLSETGRVRAMLRQFLKDKPFSPERVYDIQVAVSEAVANALEHAHGSGDVQVEVAIVDNRMEARVSGPGKFHLPTRTEGRLHRGLGLPLMAKLSDHLALFSAPENGTLLTLTFYLPGAARPTTPLPPGLTEVLSQSALLNDVLNRLPDGFLIADLDWRLLYINDPFVERYALDREEALGGLVWEVLPTLEPRIREALEAANAAGAAIRISGPVPTEDAWREWSAFPVPEGIAIISRDITRQVEAEQEVRESQRELLEKTDFFESLLHSAMVAIAVLKGRELRYTFVNPAYQAATASEADILGRRFRDVYPQVAAESETILLRVLETGERVHFQRFRAPIPGKPDAVWDAEAVRLPGRGGEEASVLVISWDVTEAIRTEEALRRSELALSEELETTRLLLEAAREVAEWADLQNLLDSLAHVVVKATSHDRATVSLWDEANGLIRFLAGAGREPVSDLSLGIESISGARHALQSGEATMVEYEKMAGGENLPGAQYDSRFALHVPLVYRGRALGLLSVDDPGERVEFTDAERAIIEGIAAQAAVGIANARLFSAQRSIADTLQQMLLELPGAIPGIRFSHTYRSATEEAYVAGDFYDMLQLGSGAIGMMIGDVSGSGVEAARVATFVKDAINAVADDENNPVKILTRANRALLRKKTASFITVLLCILLPRTRLLRFCSAGHPNPILRRASGEMDCLGGANSFPLGVFPDWSGRYQETTLRPGDILLLYTDGIIEARRQGELFGLERLVDTFRRNASLPLEELPSALIAEVLSFSDGDLRDDAAVLAVTLEE